MSPKEEEEKEKGRKKERENDIVLADIAPDSSVAHLLQPKTKGGGKKKERRGACGTRPDFSFVPRDRG